MEPEQSRHETVNPSGEELQVKGGSLEVRGFTTGDDTSWANPGCESNNASP